MRSRNLVLFTISLIVLTSVVVYSADAAGIPKKAISTVARFLESDLPTTSVFTDQASTYTAGKQTFVASSSSSAGINIPTGSDPTTPAQGDIWLNSDTLKYRGTSTHSLITSAITSINSDTNAAQTIQGVSGNTTTSTSAGTTTINTGSNVVVTGNSQQEITKNLIIDKLLDSFNIVGNADQTKQLDFLLSGQTTGTTYTIRSNQTTSQGLNLPVIRETETLAVNPQILSATPANATGTTSKTGVMAGIGGTCKITPQVTGRVHIIITMVGSSNTASDGGQAQIRYGTGTAPGNAAALTGTTLGSKHFFTTIPTVSRPETITLDYIVIGLTLGTTYWIDFAEYATTGGTASFGNIDCVAIEL